MGELFERVLRRAVTVPVYVGAFVVGTALLPLLLPAAMLHDWIRGNRFAMSRAALFGVFYFGCETVGILASAFLWITGRTRDLDAHYRLQWWWASALLGGARVLFGFRMHVEGADVVPAGDGPFLLLIRHVSVADTVLAAVLLSAAHGHRLRYVLKRELLWDPCLDIVGHRVPNCFVRRGAQSSDREIERVRALARGLTPGEGVLIYPEGARFTPERREAILRRFAEAGRVSWADRARSLRHVLPPRVGGTIALLEEAPHADVVVCVHRGFERTMRLTDLVSGALVGSRVDVAFWRIPARRIPREKNAQAAWLLDTWEDVDRWLETPRGDAPNIVATG